MVLFLWPSDPSPIRWHKCVYVTYSYRCARCSHRIVMCGASWETKIYKFIDLVSPYATGCCRQKLALPGALMCKPYPVPLYSAVFIVFRSWTSNERSISFNLRDDSFFFYHRTILPWSISPGFLFHIQNRKMGPRKRFPYRKWTGCVLELSKRII